MEDDGEDASLPVMSSGRFDQQNRIAELERELEAAKKALRDALAKHEDERWDWNRQKEALEKEATNAATELAKLKITYNLAREQLETMRNESKSRPGDIKAGADVGSADVERLRSEITRLQREGEEMQQDLDDLRAAKEGFAKDRMLWDLERARYETELNKNHKAQGTGDLYSQIRELQSSNDKSKAAATAAESARQTMQERVVQLTAELTDLRKTSPDVTEIRRLRSQAETLGTQFDKLNSEKMALELQSSEMQEKYGKMRDVLAESKSQTKQLKEKLHAEKEMYEEEIAGLRDQLRSRPGGNDVAQQLEEIHQLRSHLADLDRRAAADQQARQKAEQDKKDTAAALAKEKRARDEAEQALASLRSSLDDETLALKGAQEAVTLGLSQERDNFRAEAERERQHAAQMAAKCRSLQNELEIKERALKAHTESVRADEGDIAHVRRERDELRAQLEKATMKRATGSPLGRASRSPLQKVKRGDDSVVEYNDFDDEEESDPSSGSRAGGGGDSSRLRTDLADAQSALARERSMAGEEAKALQRAAEEERAKHAGQLQAERQRAAQQTQTLTSRVAELEQELANVTSSLSAERSAHRQQEKEAAIASTRIVQLEARAEASAASEQRSHEELLREKDVHRKDKAALEAALQDARSERDRLSGQLAALGRDDSVGSRQALAALQAQHDGATATLRSEITQLRDTHASEIRSRDAAIRDVRASLEKAQDALAVATKRAASEEAISAPLREEAREARAENARLAEQLREANRQLQMARGEAATAKAAASALESDAHLRAVQGEFERKRLEAHAHSPKRAPGSPNSAAALKAEVALRAEIDRLQSVAQQEKEATTARYEALKTALQREMEDERRRMQQDMDPLEAEIARLRAQLGIVGGERDEARANAARAEAQLGASEGRLNAMREQTHEKQDECNRLSDAMAEQRATHDAECARLSGQLQRLQRDLANTARDIAREDAPPPQPMSASGRSAPLTLMQQMEAAERAAEREAERARTRQRADDAKASGDAERQRDLEKLQGLQQELRAKETALRDAARKTTAVEEARATAEATLVELRAELAGVNERMREMKARADLADHTLRDREGEWRATQRAQQDEASRMRREVDIAREEAAANARMLERQRDEARGLSAVLGDHLASTAGGSPGKDPRVAQLQTRLEGAERALQQSAREAEQARVRADERVQAVQRRLDEERRAREVAEGRAESELVMLRAGLDERDRELESVRASGARTRRELETAAAQRDRERQRVKQLQEEQQAALDTQQAAHAEDRRDLEDELTRLRSLASRQPSTKSERSAKGLGASVGVGGDGEQWKEEERRLKMEHDAELRRLQGEMELLRRNLETSKKDLANSRADYDALQAELDALNATRGAAADADDNGLSRKELEEMNAELAEQIQSLRAQLASGGGSGSGAGGSAPPAPASAAKPDATTQRTIRDLESRVADLQRQQRDADAERESAVAEADELRESSRGLQTKIDGLQADLIAMTAQRDHAKTGDLTKTAEVDRLSALLRREQTDLAAARAHVDELRSSLGTTTDTLKSVVSKNESGVAPTSGERVQVVLGMLETTKAQLEVSEARVAALTKELAEKEALLALRDQQIRDLRHTLDQREQALLRAQSLAEQRARDLERAKADTSAAPNEQHGHRASESRVAKRDGESGRRADRGDRDRAENGGGGRGETENRSPHRHRHRRSTSRHGRSPQRQRARSEEKQVLSSPDEFSPRPGDTSYAPHRRKGARFQEVTGRLDGLSDKLARLESRIDTRPAEMTGPNRDYLAGLTRESSKSKPSHPPTTSSVLDEQVRFLTQHARSQHQAVPLARYGLNAVTELTAKIRSLEAEQRATQGALHSIEDRHQEEITRLQKALREARESNDEGAAVGELKQTLAAIARGIAESEDDDEDMPCTRQASRAARLVPRPDNIPSARDAHRGAAERARDGGGGARARSGAEDEERKRKDKGREAAAGKQRKERGGDDSDDGRNAAPAWENDPDWTPLHYAAFKGDTLLAQAKLKEFSVNARDGEGRTPLHWASHTGQHTAVRFLLGCSGVEVNAQDKGGRTPLYWASYNGHDKAVELLLKAGAITGIAAAKGVTPLHKASYAGHAAVVSLLLQHGADPNTLDSKRHTSLHKAASRGHVPVVRALMTARADSRATDGRGATAAQLAEKAGHRAVVQALQQGTVA